MTQTEQVIRDMTLSIISGRLNKSLEETEGLVGNILALIPMENYLGMIKPLVNITNLEECLEILNENVEVKE
ncbi:hypothetical protein [Peribacillus deserti]|uniref:Uncharacterized protein n=1 Tax=Peribacillus deserti TaxID=673318 RepID=A0A2N5M529_9BACI|nr:hypothetical protein [Peribacillus deserti]PLT29445.1 hypothetical protein CUU66_13160 [Peribacillus deserti]